MTIFKKESEPKGTGFDIPLEESVLFKILQNGGLGTGYYL